MKILIVIPAFNEEKSIANAIFDLRHQGYKNILVVDDGSDDQTGKKAKKAKAKVVRHAINRGLGAALGTGFAHAISSGQDIIVTFDADGQHQARDLKSILKPITSGQADVVIGSRLLKTAQKMPIDRLIISHLSNILTLLFYGFYSTDSQSGLRAFNKRAINCIKIKTDRMEVSSEFLKEIGRNSLRYREVAIEPIYTNYSRSSGQSNLNSFSVALKMFIRLFR